MEKTPNIQLRLVVLRAMLCAARGDDQSKADIAQLVNRSLPPERQIAEYKLTAGRFTDEVEASVDEGLGFSLQGAAHSFLGFVGEELRADCQECEAERWPWDLEAGRCRGGCDE